MGSIGNPIITGLVQAAQAQQVAAKDRDRSRTAESAPRERADKLELRVDEPEAPEEIREIRDEDEHRHDDRHPEPRADDEPDGDGDVDGDAEGDDRPADRPSLDLQA